MSTKNVASEPKETVKKAVTKTVEKAEESSSALRIDKSKARGILKPILFIVVLVLLLMGVDFLVQYLNNESSVAVVDGKRISRTEYIDKLEEMYGDQVAEMLVEEEVISLLAEKEGVDIDEKDINEKYAEIEEEFGGAEELEQTLFMYGMTKEELREQLGNELMMEKIIKPTLEYTEEDLSKFFEENKEFIYPDTEDITFEEKKEDIEKMYVQQKVGEKRPEIIQEFKDSITIQINTPSTMDEEDRGYGIFKATRNVIKNLFNSDETEDELEK